MLTNEVTGKSYIGQTKHSVKRRVQWHKRDAKKNRPTLIAQAIRKYGIENFTITTLDDDIDNDYIDDSERYWIKKMNTRMPNGYNMDAGGRRGNYGELHHSYGTSWHGEVIMCDKTSQKELHSFTGVMDAERYLRATGRPKASHWLITKCCLGRTKSAYGYKWKFKNYTEKRKK